jgi:inosine-uridine nucleoside N-ribohydrolase
MPITHILASAAIAGHPEGLENGKPGVNSNEPVHSQPVLIDTDGGTDDAWALFMALQAHKEKTIPFKIEAISCVHGNTSVDQVAVNVTRVLDTVNIANIAIYRGAETALVKSFRSDEPSYNGENGFGDAYLPKLLPRLESEHAVPAIIELAEIHKGNLIILASGPLTNIAMAVRLAPQIRNYVKEIYVLGGNAGGIGTNSPEFNFISDAEAAHVVLSTFSCPINIIPSETCAKYATSSYSWRLNKLGTMNTEPMGLLNKIEQNILDRYRDGWLASDAVAAAVLIEPRLVTRKANYHCTVELQGEHSRGMMIVNRSFHRQKASSVTIISEVDQPLYERMLIWAAGGEYYKKSH